MAAPKARLRVPWRAMRKPVLRANQAVRLGLRASSRNPELGFARALIDQLGNLIAFLPALLFALLVVAAADSGSIRRLLASMRALQWPTIGGTVAGLALAFAAGMLFWSGALPLVAADAEMDQRPPAGNFAVLASRGFARTLVAGLVAYGLSILFAAACTITLLTALPAASVRPDPIFFAGAAFIGTVSVAGSFFFDMLGRLLLIRAAAFGEGVTVAFGKAMSLLGARLGACFVITLAFIVLDLIVAATVGTLTTVLSGGSFFNPDTELLALAPRIAVGLAAAAVFAWLEVAHMGAFAALALDAEGLIEPEPPPAPPPPAEPVVEALPVIDALPVDDEPT